MRDYSEISNEIMAKYACDHPKKERRNRPDRNGRLMICNQCLRCGERVGDFISARSLSAAEVTTLPRFDEKLKESYFNQRLAEINATWDAEREGERAAWRARYHAHLKSPKWKALSAKTILRAQGICEGCRSRPATQAHHLTYKRMGDEMLFDLVAVCDPCHVKIHPKDEPNKDLPI
jgi:hypothetical protein